MVSKVTVGFRGWFLYIRSVCHFCHVAIVLVCHVVTKIVLDEMGKLLTLLDEMGLDEMG